MRSHPSPTIVMTLSLSLLIQSVGCSSSGASTDEVEQPATPITYPPTREALSQLDAGTKVVVMRKDSTALMGWFEGIEEPRSGSTGSEDSSLFQVVLRYKPEHGTFQGSWKTPSDSIDKIAVTKDATTGEKLSGLATSVALLGGLVGTLFLIAVVAPK